jgi:hypothetical protein
VCGIVLVAASYYAIRCVPQIPHNPRWNDVYVSAQPIVKALNAYRASHDKNNPPSLAELAHALRVQADWPLDPWGRAFVYDPTVPFLVSLGSDGAWGGSRSDEAGDVCVWGKLN